MSVVDLTETEAREVRRLRQRCADLEQTLAAVEYMRRETEAFDPATHPWVQQAVATRHALIKSCTCHQSAA